MPIETLAIGLRPSEGFSFPTANFSSEAMTADAAVVIVVTGTDFSQVLFTVRAHDMRHHAGQVAFPGGRYQAGETFPVQTALREAQEEVGLSPEGVEVLGMMAPIDTLTGFRVTPVVAWSPSVLELVPCDREVAEVFTLPLTHLLDPNSYCSHRLSYRAKGVRQAHTVWSVRSHQWPIWGATALILARLAGLTESEQLA